MADLALYDAAQHADDMWQKKLIEVHGRHNAGQSRYDSRGRATPELEELYQAKVAADAAWSAECVRLADAADRGAALERSAKVTVMQTLAGDSRFRIVRIVGKVR